MENEEIPRIKSSPVKAAHTNTNGEQNIVSDEPAKDAEEHVEEVYEKAETCEESNAASLATEATGINSWEAEQDDPVKESTQEILTGSLVFEVRSKSSDAITNDADPKSHYENALEANDIKRDEILDAEVWQQNSSNNFICEYICNYGFVLLMPHFWNRHKMHMEKPVKV